LDRKTGVKLGMRLLLGFLFFSTVSFGLIVSPAAVSEALADADLVAEIRVTDLQGLPHTENFATFAATALVERTERSSFPIARHQTIVIEGPGGEVGDRGVIFSGIPRPYREHRYRAHLKLQDNGHYRIAGFEAGLTDLSPSRQYTRNRTDGSNGEGKGAFLFWDTSFLPIPFYLSAPSFQGRLGFAEAIDASFKAWRDVADTRVEFQPMGCSQSEKNENDGLNHIILVTKDWAFGDTQIIAITRNFYIAGDSEKSGMILDSDILLNAVNHEFTTTDEAGKNDVQNIVTHEAGHFLGLGHEINPEDVDATMYAKAVPNELKKRELKANDMLGVQAAYAGSGPKQAWAGSNCDFSTPASCLAVHRETGKGWVLFVGMFWLLTVLAGRKLTSTSSTRP